LISLKYIKIFNGTPTCFDLKRSSSGSMPVPCQSHWIILNLTEMILISHG